MTKEITTEDIWAFLEDVKDPEVPVLTVVDLGVVRDVELKKDGTCLVTITPTYSGCPAMQVIEEGIKERLEREDIITEVKTILSPAWTTDWLTEKGKTKLKEYGIAPPEDEVDKSVLFGEQTKVTCPNCNSKNTKMVSQFGSTACKAHYTCKDCLEPFDYFKCLR
jgi:ring-1,2-phenylacetyl-CoA epoxidase subunit PaaD